MESENLKDGNPQPSGGAGAPSQSLSKEEGQPLPDYVKALQDQNAQLLERQNQLESQVRGVQKGTDKQIAAARSDIKRVLELQAQGLNESQITRELWIDQQMKDRDESQVPLPSGTSQPNTILDVEPVLKTLQFADNDPGLAALRIKHAGKPQELLAAAANLRMSQLTGAGPTPGTGMPLSNGQQSLSSAAQLEQDTQDYLKELQAGAGKGYQFGDAIKEKYRQKGVPVDSITIKF